MAIRFADKPSDEPPKKAARAPVRDESAQAQGEARFATPLAAAKPVNPDAASELPFTDLPPAEKTERRKRGPKPAAPK